MLDTSPGGDKKKKKKRSTMMEIQVYRLLVALALATIYPPWVSIRFADLLKPISLVHGACR